MYFSLRTLYVIWTSLTKTPRSTTTNNSCPWNDTDRKMRRFHWGKTALEMKKCMVSWNVVTKPKKCGGLGLRSMRRLNLAPLVKLSSRINIESNALEAKDLNHRYCIRCDFISNVTKTEPDRLVQPVQL